MVVVVVLVSGAGGYCCWTRARSRPASPVLDAAGHDTPEAIAAGTASPRVPADYQALESQLAICMAFHPPEDEKDKQLAMCRADLAVYRGPRPTLPDRYELVDFAPIYDRELWEVDPSPVTLERRRGT